MSMNVNIDAQAAYIAQGGSIDGGEKRSNMDGNDLDINNAVQGLANLAGGITQAIGGIGGILKVAGLIGGLF